MAPSVTISQEDGLTLTLSTPSGRTGVLVAGLAGTGFDAQITVNSEAAFPELGRLEDFLSAAAGVPPGQKLQWTAVGDDLDLRAEVWDDGLVQLRVYLGSTSDDACVWQVNASLPSFARPVASGSPRGGRVIRQIARARPNKSLQQTGRP